MDGNHGAWRPRILSVENWEPPKSWSWGIVINSLIDRLQAFKFSRVRRGLFTCPNPKCGAVFTKLLDHDLVMDYDIIFPHNPDTLRIIPPGGCIVCRIGGLDMKNINRERYSAEFKRVAAIVATNTELANIARVANPNVAVIPNGVDLDHFKPADPNPNYDRPFTIGFAGNCWGPGADYKGWKYFVEASVKLQALCGIESFYLLHRSNQIPHNEMPTGFYHKIDALILPSQGEGCSNVVTEALACGVPPLLTKVGFHGERLEHEKNCLFIDRSDQSIIEAVERLVNDRELRERICSNARAFAIEHHDIMTVAQQYEKVFQSVLKGSSNGNG